MKIEMRFEGGAELAKALEELSMRVGKSVMREALREGAEPIRKYMAQAAPQSSEGPHLRDHMVIGNARTGDMAAVAIGPRKGFAPRSHIYPFAQEYGTVHHSAQPFMRPAFDAQAATALKMIAQELWRLLASKGITRSATVDTPVQSPGALL
jgi:HK97 gp10 family phage protein